MNKKSCQQWFALGGTVQLASFATAVEDNGV